MKKLVALSPMYTEDSNILKKASIGSSYELSRFNGKWSVPEEFRTAVVAVYGEDIYAEIVAEQCCLTLTKPEDHWLSVISGEFTKRKIAYGQLKDVAHEGPIFIKCSDFKSFKAGVFDKVTDIKGFDSLDPEITVFISEIVEWELEVRCFVLNGTIKTFSSYWRNDVYDTGPACRKRTAGIVRILQQIHGRVCGNVAGSDRAGFRDYQRERLGADRGQSCLVLRTVCL